MSRNLERELSNIRHGDHICLPYEEHAERRDVMIRFAVDGLARGERCIYILEDGQRHELLSGLAAAGVDAARALDRGALWLRTAEEIYFRSGKFDADDTLAFIEELIGKALADGFTGLRGTGEIPAGKETAVPWETILSYEARVNEWFSKRPFVGLCRYRRSAFSPSVIRDVLRTHPVAVVSDRVCRNPYFEKPDVALAIDGEAARVDWMLRQLRWSRLTEQRLRDMTRSLAEQAARLAAENQTRQQSDEQLGRAVRTRDRLLALLARELAMPVAALSEELRGRGGAAGEIRSNGSRPEREGTVGRHLRRLGSLVETLRNVSRLTNRQTPLDLEDADLVDIARQVLLRHRDELAAAGCKLEFHAPARIQGTWDRRRVELLLASLIGNAARHGARHPISIVLTADADSARAEIALRGMPLAPDGDEEHLFDDGAPGLWSARDIAGALGGSLRIAETAARPHGSGACPELVETTLTLELPRSPRRPDDAQDDARDRGRSDDVA